MSRTNPAIKLRAVNTQQMFKETTTVLHRILHLSNSGCLQNPGAEGEKKLIIILNLAQFWRPQQLVSQTTTRWCLENNWHNLPNILSQTLSSWEPKRWLLLSCCCPPELQNKIRRTEQHRPAATPRSANHTSNEDTLVPLTRRDKEKEHVSEETGGKKQRWYLVLTKELSQQSYE